MKLYTVFSVKQKTAYEMLISDWSSDVCSSDLEDPLPSEPPPAAEPKAAPTMPPPDEPPPSPAIPRNAVRPSGGPAYGPPDSGGSSSRACERVGTAPNGEPPSAAAGHRAQREDRKSGV